MSEATLTIDEMEMILRHWESIDGVWSDETKAECIEALTTMNQSKEWWMNLLIKVPADVNDRYRKVCAMLLDKQLITQQIHDDELKVMESMSPAAIARQGKVLADWWRAA